MSVVRWTEVVDGRGGNQKFTESVRTKRSFEVTVDTPTTPLKEIADAPGVQWLDPHPEFAAILCTEIAVNEDGDPLHYRVVFTYDLVKVEDRELTPWERKPKFSYSGSITTGPAIIHYNNGFADPKFITNSAGDPLEGATKEYSEWKISIQINRQTFDRALATAYLNAVNSDVWSGCPPGTVKCQNIGGTDEIEQVAGLDVSYWAITAELAFRPEGWRLQMWDIGFNELSGGERVPVRNKIGEPVADRVALRNGQALPAGSPPDMLTFRVYSELPFNGAFPVLP
jgi:hypothetical protein